MGGRVSLPHPYSRLESQNRPARTKKTPPQLQSSHPWGSPTEIPNLRSISPLHPNRSPPQELTRSLHPPSLPLPSLRPSASPPYRTSRSQILLTTKLPSTLHSQVLLIASLLSTPRPSLRTKYSTSRTGTWKCCAVPHFSVSTRAYCPSTLPRFAVCSPGQTWSLRNHQTVAPAFSLQTRPRISPRFSR